MTGVNLSATTTDAQTGQQQYKYTISGAGGSVEKTFTNQSRPGTHSFTWDGKNSLGTLMPKELYSVKVNVYANTPTTSGDCNRSSYLSIESPNTGINEVEYYKYDDNGTINDYSDDKHQYLVSYKLKDTGNLPGSEGQILLYGPNLDNICSWNIDALQCVTDGWIHDGLHADSTGAPHRLLLKIPISYFTNSGTYNFVIHIKDNHSDDYKNHQNRWCVEKILPFDQPVPGSVHILMPAGSADMNPATIDSWSETLSRFDFQGVIQGTPGGYSLDMMSIVRPITYGVLWTLDSSAGTLTDRTSVIATHTPPASPGIGDVKLQATSGGTPLELLDRRKIIIYQDHLARDYYNFGTNISCISILSNPWTFTQFGVTVEMFDSWNCHGSVWHAYDGSGDGDVDHIPSLPVIAEIHRGPWASNDYNDITANVINDMLQNNNESPLTKGDIIAYFTSTEPIGIWELQHSQTLLSGTTTYGANNEPITYPANQTWKWAESEAGIYLNDLQYYGNFINRKIEIRRRQQ